MRAVMIVFTLLGLLVVLLLAFSQAPSFHAPLTDVAQAYVLYTYARIGIPNIISAVNFDWRGFDTLGESTLLFTAAVGIRLVLRRYLQRRRETGQA